MSKARAAAGEREAVGSTRKLAGQTSRHSAKLKFTMDSQAQRILLSLIQRQPPPATEGNVNLIVYCEFDRLLLVCARSSHMQFAVLSSARILAFTFRTFPCFLAIWCTCRTSAQYCSVIRQTSQRERLFSSPATCCIRSKACTRNASRFIFRRYLVRRQL